MMENLCLSISRILLQGFFFLVQPLLSGELADIYRSYLLAMHSYNFGLGFGSCWILLFLGDNLGALRAESSLSFLGGVNLLPSQSDSYCVDLLKIGLFGGKEYTSSVRRRFIGSFVELLVSGVRILLPGVLLLGELTTSSKRPTDEVEGYLTDIIAGCSIGLRVGVLRGPQENVSRCCGV